MRAEVIDSMPSAETGSLNSFFDNDGKFRNSLVMKLVTGDKDILTKTAKQINDLDQLKKLEFLQRTFYILSNSDPLSQNQRDAGLELLRAMNLKNVKPKELEEVYVYNLRHSLNKESDPDGEIYALLEAGKIIAPFILSLRITTREWNKVAKLFTGKTSQTIQGGIEKMRWQRLCKFDQSVAELAKQGIRNADIALQLEVLYKEVIKAKERLRRSGFTSNRPSGRQKTKETTIFS